MNYDNIKIISFDCYGTLIDWESGILNALRPFFDRSKIEVSNELILNEFASQESEAEKGSFKSYKEILKIVLIELSKNFEFELFSKEEYTISDSIKYWVPFHDSVEALKLLSTKYELAIISNIDNDLFSYSESNLKTKFSHIITAEQVGSYKPSHNNFKFALNKFESKNKTRSEINGWLHCAQSLYHDIKPTNELKIPNVWINRRSNKKGYGATPKISATANAEFTDLMSFAIEVV